MGRRSHSLSLPSLPRVPRAPGGKRVSSRPPGQAGQGMIEYALILVLVAIVVIVVLTTMGQQIGKVFQDLGTQLSRT